MSEAPETAQEARQVSEYDRQSQIMVDVFFALGQARGLLMRMPPSREGALAMTKIDEARLWSQTIPVPPREAPDNPDGPTAAN